MYQQGGWVMLQQYITNRLIMRILNEESANKVLDFHLENRDTFSPFEPLQPAEFYTLTYQEAALKAETRLLLRASSLRYYLFDLSDDTRILGTICFYHMLPSPYNSCKLGYRIHKMAQKKGYAYEALSYLLPLVFTELGLHRIEADILPENKDSLQLIERLGFTYEGISRSSCEISGVRRDHLHYTLTSFDQMPYSPTPQN